MNLCAPALIYLVFSITQIIIDTFKGFYNTALMKFVVMIMVTLLLNVLCDQGLNIVSWFIVFIPFIFMTFIVSLLLYIFGLDSATGKLKIACNTTENNDEKQTGVSYLGQIDQTGNIIFINPSSSSSSSSSSSYSSSTTDNSDVTTNPDFYTPPIFNTKNVVAASSIPGFDRLI